MCPGNSVSNSFIRKLKNLDFLQICLCCYKGNSCDAESITAGSRYMTEKFQLRYFCPFKEVIQHAWLCLHTRVINGKTSEIISYPFWKPVASLRKILVHVASCWAGIHNVFDRIHRYFYAWPPTLSSDSSHKTQVEGIRILQTFLKHLPGKNIGLSKDDIEFPKTFSWLIKLKYQLDRVDLNWFNELSLMNLKIPVTF